MSISGLTAAQRSFEMQSRRVKLLVLGIPTVAAGFAMLVRSVVRG